VVGGSASGSKYYDGDPTRPWVNVVYDTNNPIFSILKFRGDDLIFEAYAIEYGTIKVIDTFTLTKRSNIIDGDINFDGEVTVDDAKLLLQAITGKRTLTKDELQAAGITGNEVSLSDVRRILSMVGE